MSDTISKARQLLAFPNLGSTDLNVYRWQTQPVVDALLRVCEAAQEIAEINGLDGQTELGAALAELAKAVEGQDV